MKIIKKKIKNGGKKINKKIKFRINRKDTETKTRMKNIEGEQKKLEQQMKENGKINTRNR